MKRGLKLIASMPSCSESLDPAAESTPMKRGLKRHGSRHGDAGPDGRREHPDEEGTETQKAPRILPTTPRAAESTPMKRGLKRRAAGLPDARIIHGRREHPDEEGTETP